MCGHTLVACHGCILSRVCVYGSTFAGILRSVPAIYLSDREHTGDEWKACAVTHWMWRFILRFHRHTSELNVDHNTDIHKPLKIIACMKGAVSVRLWLVCVVFVSQIWMSQMHYRCNFSLMCSLRRVMTSKIDLFLSRSGGRLVLAHPLLCNASYGCLSHYNSSEGKCETKLEPCNFLELSDCYTCFYFYRPGARAGFSAGGSATAQNLPPFSLALVADCR